MRASVLPPRWEDFSQNISSSLETGSPPVAPLGHPLGGRGFVSPGQASHLQSSDWESITEVVWEHEAGELDRSVRGSRPVGALMHGPTAHTHL